MSGGGAEEDEGGRVVYLVRKEPGAEPQRVPRSKLRHRVAEKQCHPGITDDTALPTHSDNAAQHFKSSRNLHFFTKQLFGERPAGSNRGNSRRENFADLS